MTEHIMPTRKGFCNIIGNKYSHLLVIEYAGKDKYNNRKWLCICDCGKETAVWGNALRYNTQKSCGCMSSLLKSSSVKTHKMSDTPEYASWYAMIYRCTKSSHMHYKNYGGRGIGVCDRWINSFENFFADMGRKPDKSYSIDRIDNSLGYSKENCRWSTTKENCRNTRSNRIVIFGGVKMTVSAACELSSVPTSTAYGRLEKGWPIERVFKRTNRSRN